jgi:hypothetical protein
MDFWAATLLPLEPPPVEEVWIDRPALFSESRHPIQTETPRPVPARQTTHESRQTPQNSRI